MRALLALTAFLAFLPKANAAMTSGDKQLSTNAEFRARYTFEDKQSGTNALIPNDGNSVEQRLRLGGTYKVSEKFGVSATLLDNLNWGAQDLYIYNSNGTPGTYSSGDSPAVHNGASTNNVMLVQEAYGYWMLSDDVLVRFGRQSLNMADGSIIGTNDYDPIPNAFDGILGTYEFDFGRISIWAVKFATYDNGLAAKMSGLGAATGTGLSGNNSSDPEADGYGVSFDLKRMPEFLKMVNLHVIDNSKDSTPGAFTAPWYMADPLSTMGQSTLRYGLAIGGAAAMFDYNVDAEGVSGRYFCSGAFAQGCKGTTLGNADPTITSFSTTQYMVQAEAGLDFPEFMKIRLFVKGHFDSGDSELSPTKISTYDPYYYNKADGSGMMQVVGWGNLTFYNVGLTASPTDQTTVGLQYFLFQKTHEQGNMNPGRYGDMVEFTSPNSTDLGQEIDLWAEQKYDGGFSILAHVGEFLPGTSIKNGMAENANALQLSQPNNPGGQVFPANVSRNQSFTQVVVQGKMTF